MAVSLDEIDLKILDILQNAGRTRRNDLAEAVGLSLPAASERLRKLEEQKLITGYHATLDHKRLGNDITAFIIVAVDSSKHYGQFIEHTLAQDEVMECHAITGEGTHLLKIRTCNTASLERLLAKIQAWTGVQHTHTSLVLSSAKETARIKFFPTSTLPRG
jgi:Lrp/AsnC family transcriptional regulator, leucine-responsive regulatory protein